MEITSKPRSLLSEPRNLSSEPRSYHLNREVFI